MRKTLAIVAVIAVVLFGLAVPAGADSASRPFKGSMTGEATWGIDLGCLDVNPFGLLTDSTATGKATHLGRLTMTSQHCTPMGPEITGGLMEFVAANGDEVHLEYWGTTPTLDELVLGEVFSVDIEFVVVGGTGRFDGATGGGDMIGLVLFEGPDVTVVPADWYFDGTIGY